jgi:translation initiation factor IF-3
MAKRKKGGSQRVIKENPHKINGEIRANEVKLVTEDGANVMSLSEALKTAEEQDLDLVLVGDKATPPVVKLMDYAKFLYNQSKKPQVKNKPMKEVRFTPNTDENDLNFKTKHINNFLKKGHKVKIFVFFRGREMVYKERGEKILLELAIKLEDVADVESMPKIEGRKMLMYLKPKTKAK